MPTLTIYVSEETLATLEAFGAIDSMRRDPATLAEHAVEEAAIRTRVSIPELDRAKPCQFSV